MDMPFFRLNLNFQPVKVTPAMKNVFVIAGFYLYNTKEDRHKKAGKK
jgi:hypothetical protein